MDEQEFKLIEMRSKLPTHGRWRAGRPDMMSYDGMGGQPFKYVYIGKHQEIKINTCRPIEDSQFIAHAKEDIKTLIKEVKRLRRGRKG